MRGSQDMMSRIEEIIGPSLEAMGFDLIRLRLSGGDRPTLQIMAERPDGTMTVADCTHLSRTISVLLDVEDPIAGEYMLEVSSPGIDRPLIRESDFERYAGHLVKLQVSRPIEGQRKFTGTIERIADSIVRIVADDETVSEIPFDDISTAQLIITDALIRASLSKNPEAEAQP